MTMPTQLSEHARKWWKAMDRRQSEIIGELFARVEKLETQMAELQKGRDEKWH